MHRHLLPTPFQEDETDDILSHPTQLVIQTPRRFQRSRTWRSTPLQPVQTYDTDPSVIITAELLRRSHGVRCSIEPTRSLSSLFHLVQYDDDQRWVRTTKPEPTTTLQRLFRTRFRLSSFVLLLWIPAFFQSDQPARAGAGYTLGLPSPFRFLQPKSICSTAWITLGLSPVQPTSAVRCLLPTS